VRKSHFIAHLDECPENKRSCEFCGEGTAICQYDEHVRTCYRHRRSCYICGRGVQAAALAEHMVGCSQGNRVLRMFHGTSMESARAILRAGFRPSTEGLLGAGVYLSRDVKKATNYGPVVIEAQVDVGRVAVIDKRHHQLQRCWNAHGHDSAWIPPNCGVTRIGLEEHCVFDPNRVAVVGVVQPSL
jgi:hypothetical protein